MIYLPGKKYEENNYVSARKSEGPVGYVTFVSESGRQSVSLALRNAVNLKNE